MPLSTLASFRIDSMFIFGHLTCSDLSEYFGTVLRRTTVLHQANLDFIIQLITDVLIVEPVGNVRLHIGEFLKVFGTEEILFLANFEYTLNLVTQSFLHHFSHFAVHRVSISVCFCSGLFNLPPLTFYEYIHR
jgi:hypothetical protein